jgi:hypothetical protein
MNRLICLVALFCWIGVSMALAQESPRRPYSAQEQSLIALQALKVLKSKYLDNLENLTHYERHQPSEALEPHIRATLREVFLNESTRIFNEFRPKGHTYTTFREYVGDCRIHSDGFPLHNDLELALARFGFDRTADGKPYVSVYVKKRIESVNKQKSTLFHENLVAFRMPYIEERVGGFFHSFKIGGIEQVTAVPAAALAISAEIPPPPLTLSSVVEKLIEQLSTVIPKGTPEIAVDWITYKNGGVPNAFSDALHATFSKQFPHKTGQTLAASPTAQTPIRLRGVFEESDLADKLILSTRLVEVSTGRVLAEARNATLPLSWLTEQGFELVPDNTHRPPSPPIPVLPLAEFKVEISSNRGREVVEFWEGDYMNYFLTATRPCYARVLGLQSDGVYVLVEENLHIKPGQENQKVPLLGDYNLHVAAPFGTEYLLVFASEKPLLPLPRTPRQGGYVRREGDQELFVGTPSDIVRLSAGTQDGTVAQDRIQLTTRSKLQPK